ncbi:MAG: porin family protein [Agriterribacter sp.]
MLKPIIVFAFVCCICIDSFAQNTVTEGTTKKWKHYVHAGFNFGALAPVSLPNTIRKIESFSPSFSPSLGYEVVYALNERWGIGAGLKLEYKGMNTKDSVAYFHTIISMDDAAFEGDFTGTNTTRVQNGYITLPVHVVYAPGGKWRYKAGLYVARLIDAGFSGNVSDGYIRKGDSMGEKVAIDVAAFNFADTERSFDWGVQGGAERKVWKKLAVNANMNWGLRPVFPSSFKGIGFNMYNLFLTVGAAWEL